MVRENECTLAGLGATADSGASIFSAFPVDAFTGCFLFPCFAIWLPILRFLNVDQNPGYGQRFVICRVGGLLLAFAFASRHEGV
jgi:hypothetical protein